MSSEYLAHSANQFGEVDPLKAHLQDVAKRAAEFAGTFDGARGGDMLQAYFTILENSELSSSNIPGKSVAKGTDTHHAAYGAAFAFNNKWPCAFADRPGTMPACMTSMIFRQCWTLARKETNQPLACPSFKRTVCPDCGRTSRERFPSGVPPRRQVFRVRFGIGHPTIFSSLVDADHLDTEEHSLGQVCRSGFQRSARSCWEASCVNGKTNPGSDASTRFDTASSINA